MAVMEKQMKVLIIYCHPSKNSFTYEVKEAFIKGLESAGHSYEVSDLYADGFNPVMLEKEYIREGFYNLDSPVSEDVLFEQKKINEADEIAFIYPDFWTSSPAMLGFKHKTMMGMLYKKAVTLPEDKKTSEVRAMIETYNKQVDFVDLITIEPIVKACFEI